MKRYNFKKAFRGKRNKRRVKRATKVIDKIGKYKNRVSTVAQLAALGLNGMRLLNVEKKRVDFTRTNQAFAQFSNAGSTIDGIHIQDVTPVIAEGITGSTRNGLSVKLVSACVDMQIKQQTSTVNQLRYKWYLLCRPDANTTTTAGTVKDLFFEPNPFSTVRDYFSNRDPEGFNQCRIIKYGRGSLSQDQITNGVASNQFKIPLRLNHHLKYQSDAITTTSKNQMFLMVVADSGNTSTTSGALISYNIRWYYVDN